MTAAQTQWYVVRVLSGREETVRDNLIRRVKADGLEHRIPQVVVPVERVTEVKAGKKRVTSRKIYPGYLLLEAHLGDPHSDDLEDQKVWYVLHETPGFGDFVGGRNQPSPMSDEEVRNILDRMSESAETPRMAVKIKRGDMVRIKEGPFEGFDGTVEEVLDTKGLLRISVTIFGRATSVEIEHWQVEPV
jgi:transcriptional antiterminator NusG